MKFLLLILTFITVINANDNYVKEKNKENLEKIKKEQLSQREKDYLKYKRDLEAENEKLEEEGFCSCNND